MCPISQQQINWLLLPLMSTPTLMAAAVLAVEVVLAAPAAVPEPTHRGSSMRSSQQPLLLQQRDAATQIAVV